MTDLVQRFTEIDERNLQLDIFRDNGRVLIQVFKYSDVKGWNNPPVFDATQGYVSVLHFSGSKDKNLKNFQNSKVFEYYHSFDSFGKHFYCSFTPTTSTPMELQAFLLRTIKEVYGNDVGTLDVQLNAY